MPLMDTIPWSNQYESSKGYNLQTPLDPANTSSVLPVQGTMAIFSGKCVAIFPAMASMGTSPCTTFRLIDRVFPWSPRWISMLSTCFYTDSGKATLNLLKTDDSEYRYVLHGWWRADEKAIGKWVGRSLSVLLNMKVISIEFVFQMHYYIISSLLTLFSFTWWNEIYTKMVHEVGCRCILLLMELTLESKSPLHSALCGFLTSSMALESALLLVGLCGYRIVFDVDPILTMR